MKINNLIKQANYTLLLPQEGIKPLDLILRKEQNFFNFFKSEEGSLMNATLKDLFVAKGRGVTYPTVKEGNLPSLLSGKDILSTDSKFVASFLTDDGAKTKFKSSTKALFSFEDSIETNANWVQIDEYLQFADLKNNNALFEQLQKGNVYIILSVLASKKFSIKVADDFEVSGEVDMNKLAEYVAKIEAQTSHISKENYIIKQEGDKPLVFAVKTAKILYKNSRYRIKESEIDVRNATEKKEDVNFFDEYNEIVFD